MVLDKEDFLYYKGFVEGWRKRHYNQLNANEQTLRQDLIEHSKITDEETLAALLNLDNR